MKQTLICREDASSQGTLCPNSDPKDGPGSFLKVHATLVQICHDVHGLQVVFNGPPHADRKIATLHLVWLHDDKKSIQRALAATHLVPKT